MLRSTRLVPFIVPAGVIPSAGRSQVYPTRGHGIEVLGLLASNIGSAIARFSGEKFEWPKFQKSMVQSIGYSPFPPTLLAAMSSKISDEVNSRIRIFQMREETIYFRSIDRDTRQLDVPNAPHFFSLLGEELELAVAQALGISEQEYSHLNRELREAISIARAPTDEEEEDGRNAEDGTCDWAHSAISYCVGVLFGRWNVRVCFEDPSTRPYWDVFDMPPMPPSGLLANREGGPAGPGDLTCIEIGSDNSASSGVEKDTGIPSEMTREERYPLSVAWNGIIPADIGHPLDVESSLRKIICFLWNDNATDMEQHLCHQVDACLAQYMRSLTGFFAKHLSRYSKSRRQAPIYWPLSTPSSSYTLWLYYHRLTDQTLYTCINDFLDPKIRQLVDESNGLLRKVGTVGGGRAGTGTVDGVPAGTDGFSGRTVADRAVLAAELERRGADHGSAVVAVVPASALATQAERDLGDARSGRLRLGPPGHVGLARARGAQMCHRPQPGHRARSGRPVLGRRRSPAGET
jgi:hypothetical protein